MSMDERKVLQVALGVGAAAALGAAVIKLYQRSQKRNDGFFESLLNGSLFESGLDYTNPASVSHDNMVALLDELAQNQSDMRKLMDSLAERMAKESWDFSTACTKIEEEQPISPLEKHGLTAEQLSKLLIAHNSSPVVRSKIVSLTQAPSETAASSGEGADDARDTANAEDKMRQLASQFSIEKLIEVHNFMLEVLGEIVGMAESSESCRNLNRRSATLAAQTYVGMKVKDKYGISCGELENLAVHFHSSLGTNQEFYDIGQKLRESLGRLSKLCGKAGL